MRLGSIGKVLVAVLCFAGYFAITFLIVPIVTFPPEIPFVRVAAEELSLNVSYQYGFLRCNPLQKQNRLLRFSHHSHQNFWRDRF